MRRHTDCPGVDSLEIAQRASHFGKLCQRRIVVFLQTPGSCAGDLHQPARIRCERIPLEDFLLLVRLNLRGVDLAYLVAEKVEFALEGGLVRSEFIAFGRKLVELTPSLAV
jgi:hypothetical protein